MTDNKQHHPIQAVALKYDEVKAPVVTAKGEAGVAAEIVRIAREHDIPLYENAELVKVLARLELGEEIPPVLYRVIAEMIAFAWYIKGRMPGNSGDTANDENTDQI